MSEEGVMVINDPATLAEVEAIFAAYETALLQNDNETLARMFLVSSGTVRYGLNDVQHGYSEVMAFRATQQPFERKLDRTVITSYGIYWASGTDLCRLDATAALGVPLVGCPVTHRVGTVELGGLTGGDGDRIGFVTLGQQLVQPEDAALYRRSTDTAIKLTDDILEQSDVEVWRDRVAFTDRQRFSNDIVLRDQTEGTWRAPDRDPAWREWRPRLRAG